MNHRYIPPIVFGLSWLGFLAYWASTLHPLPPRLAIHFGPAGRPDNWATGTEYAILTGAMGLGLPLFIVGVAYVIRWMPNHWINFPGDHDDWLAPERRADTMAYLFRQSFWPASMTIGLIAGVHALTLQANRQGVALAQLSVPATIALFLCFLIAFGVWFFAMYRHFRNVE